MPHFVVIARDGTDDKALERRMAARPAHIAMGDEAVARGEQIFGVAMMNDGDTMCGSVIVVDFPDREALDEWLKTEPYVTGGVWKNIEVIPCRIGPSFQKVLQR